MAASPCEARWHWSCDFASTGTLLPSPPFLLYLDGIDAPLAQPLTAVQATQLQALYPSCIVPATSLRLEDGYDAMLGTIRKMIAENLGPSGRAITLLPTYGNNAGRPFGSLVVLLPSFRDGGTITFAHGRQTAIIDATTSPVEMAYASFYSVTSISSAPITTGHHVALAYRLIYTATHNNMRMAPANQELAIAAFTALAASPLDEYQHYSRPIAYPHTEGGLCFGRLQRVDKCLVDVLLATKSFDVALVTRYQHTQFRDVVLHRACAVPDEVAGACEHYARHAHGGAPNGDELWPIVLLVFCPTHLRVAMVDRATHLTEDHATFQLGTIGETREDCDYAR